MAKSCVKYVMVFILLFLLCPPVLSQVQVDADSFFLDPDYTKTISMDFQDAHLVDVLKIFSQQSGMNLLTSESLRDRTVTVFLDKVPVAQALEKILRANSLIYELMPDSEIFLIKPLAMPDEELITRIYQLKNASVVSSQINQTLNIKSEEDAEILLKEDSETIGLIAAVTNLLTDKGKLIEDPRTNSLIITDIHSNFPMIEKMIAGLDVKIPQILIEVEMLEVTKSSVDKLGVKLASPTLVTLKGGEREVYLPWESNKLYNPRDEYTAGSMDATTFSAALDFLKTQTDTKNLARPRILTLNNQAAQIKISTDENIGSTQQTTDLGGGTQTSEAQREETGVFLTVTPQANVMTREVTMAIVPKVIIARVSTLDSTTKDPEERGTQSILRVKSGDTIVLGGLMRTDGTKVSTKIPFLGDLPLLGNAFRHKSDEVTEKELIIFITPIILEEDSLATLPQQLNPSKKLLREQDAPTRQVEAADKALSHLE